MRQFVDAVFEHGVFRPIVAPKLAEGDMVRLTVDAKLREQTEVDEIVMSAANVFDGLSTEEIAEIERIACDRSGFSTGRPLP